MVKPIHEFELGQLDKMSYEYDEKGQVAKRTTATLEATDIEIGAVEIKDATSENRVIVDSDGALKVTGGASSPDAEFTSPKDFTATYTSTTTITLSSLDIALDDSSQIAYVTVIPSAGTGATTYTQASNGVTLTVSSNVVTIAGAGTPFASGDVYQVGLNGQKKAYDANLDGMKNYIQNWQISTDPELLVSGSDIVATIDTYKDQGSEISMGKEYNTLGLFVKFTANDSETNTIKILSKHESGSSADEFVLETSGDYIKTLGDANINIFYEFDNSSLIPYLQIQSTAHVVGATEGTLEIYIVKGRK